MFADHTVSVVIPCMNERKGIERVFASVPPCVDEVIIVDHKSTDGTPEFAQSKGARVFREDRRGYGTAYKKGFKEARGDIIVTADGDATYPLYAIPDMITYLLDNGLDFVSGCRFPLKAQKSMRIRNFVGNMLITAIAVILFRHKVTDLLSGMWVFKKSIYDRLHLVSDGWNFSEEITIEAIRDQGIRFGEYHIDYFEREGQTKLWPLHVGVGNVLFLFRKKINCWLEKCRLSVNR